MTEDLKETRFTFAELDQIAARCKAEEYALTIFTTSYDKVHLSLEKGSTYGQMHMKFSAEAPTVSEAFSKALANFPANPVGAVWDTKRLAHQQPAAGTVEDGEFVEAPCGGKTASTDDDDIPF